LPNLAVLSSAGAFSLNSQAFLTIQSVNQFVIDQPNFPTKQYIKRLIAVMVTTAGEVPQSDAELDPLIARALVPVCRTRKSKDGTDTPLAYSVSNLIFLNQQTPQSGP
jgi:hypothetical protein